MSTIPAAVRLQKRSAGNGTDRTECDSFEGSVGKVKYRRVRQCEEKLD